MRDGTCRLLTPARSRLQARALFYLPGHGIFGFFDAFAGYEAVRDFFYYTPWESVQRKML
jgi:hypothetical protein